MRIPDAIEPVSGYRAWAVGLGRLWSPRSVAPAAWPVTGPLVATCRLARRPAPFSREAAIEGAHEAPYPSCSCGIYAVFEPWDLGRIDTREPFRLVIGRAVGWGRVVVGGHGWRAERASVLDLFIDPAWDEATLASISRIADTYGVPLVDASVPRSESAA
jgi:hypothetical protein